MAIEKPLKVRDYLEPRSAAAAGSRSINAARKSLSSFQDILKNEKFPSTEGVAAGMKISQYLKSPVLRTQTPRSSIMSAGSNNAAIGSRATENAEQARLTKTPRPGESDRVSKAQGDSRTRRFQRNPSSESRADTTSSQPVEKSIQQAAAKYSLAPELIRSVIRAESNFQAGAVSPAGAKGLMQLMPYVAESIACELGIEWGGDRTLFDPLLNIKMGVHYLSRLLFDFKDTGLAVTAYNYGPTYVRGLIEKKAKIPRHFYEKIVTTYHDFVVSSDGEAYPSADDAESIDFII